MPELTDLPQPGTRLGPGLTFESFEMDTAGLGFPAETSPKSAIPALDLIPALTTGPMHDLVFSFLAFSLTRRKE